jgi:hypothetical protein
MVKLSSMTARALILYAVLFAKYTLAASDVLWQPAQNVEGIGYSRVIQLQHAGSANGNLLATFEHWYTNDAPSHYIIQQSTNNGTTWETLTTVTAPGDLPTQFYYQPFLFEFPQQLGKYAEGTILLVGNLQDINATDFYSWRSSDHGKTWDPVGVWQKGWAPGGPNTSHGIWEPFLFLDNHSNLVAVFSDERENEVHSQKLVQVVSKDGGDTWSKNATNIVVGSEQFFRPGMATVAKMDNGEYFMSYEWCDTRNYGKHCSVHGKTSKDGVTWDASDEGVFVSSPDGVQAVGSPYSIWDPVGKQLIVSSKGKQRFSASYLDDGFYLVEDRHAVHINLDHGSGDWHWASTPWHVPVADNCDIHHVNYSPNLLSLPNGTILYSAKTPAPPGAQCQESTGAAAIGILPYSSDFSVTGDAGWIDFDEIWSVSGDQYTFPPVTDPATIVLTGSSGWTDYEISADAIVTSSSGVVGLLARASHLYTAPNNITRYTAAIDSNHGDFTLFRVDEKGANILSSKPVPGGIKAHQKYHLSLSVKSATLVATVAGSGGAKTSFSATDDDLGRGMAGLFGSYGSGGFSNVQIKRVT